MPYALWEQHLVGVVHKVDGLLRELSDIVNIGRGIGTWET